MSEKRLTLFPKNISEVFPDEDELIQILIVNNFIHKDPKRKGYYILSPKYMSLLDQDEDYLNASEEICVWFEYFEEIEIQVGSDSQHIESVKTPDTGKVIGDLDFAYSLISKLHENIDVKYIDKSSDKSYYIRDLDFSNYIGYGKTFMHVDRYFRPTERFIYELENILKFKIKFSLFWL